MNERYATPLDGETEFEPIPETYNTHYIRADGQGRIIDGWSDAFRPATDDAVLLTGQGGYQFRLFPSGEENPPLRDECGVPLYAWDGKQAQRRSQREIEADRPSPADAPAIDPAAFVLGFMEALTEAPL